MSFQEMESEEIYAYFLKTFFKALDNHSSFLLEKEMKSFQKRMQGKEILVGIGVSVTVLPSQGTPYLEVKGILRGGPCG